MAKHGTGVVGAILGLSMVLLAGRPASAVQSKCLVSKNKCVAEKAGALLKCEQKAETPGKPADPNAGGCVAAASWSVFPEGGDQS